MRKVAPVSPGEMLEEEFLIPLGMTKYRLAKEIGVPRNASRHHRDHDWLLGGEMIRRRHDDPALYTQPQ